MKRIYLSGPMTGRPNLNFPAFQHAADRLRALGYDVVSPAEIVPGTKATWHDAMRTDIKDLLDCDTLALLDGWQESAGAHLEMHVAHRVGIKIVVEAEIVERAQDPQPDCAADLEAARNAILAGGIEEGKLKAEVERLRGVIRRAAAAFEMGCDARETYDRLRAALSGKEAQ